MTLVGAADVVLGQRVPGVLQQTMRAQPDKENPGHHQHAQQRSHPAAHAGTRRIGGTQQANHSGSDHRGNQQHQRLLRHGQCAAHGQAGHEVTPQPRRRSRHEGQAQQPHRHPHVVGAELSADHEEARKQTGHQHHYRGHAPSVETLRHPARRPQRDDVPELHGQAQPGQHIGTIVQPLQQMRMQPTEQRAVVVEYIAVRQQPLCPRPGNVRVLGFVRIERVRVEPCQSQDQQEQKRYPRPNGEMALGSKLHRGSVGRGPVSGLSAK